jgi:hypothetical protein
LQRKNNNPKPLDGAEKEKKKSGLGFVWTLELQKEEETRKSAALEAMIMCVGRTRWLVGR